MKFSGHETFQVREGWLHKGLKLVCESPEKMADEFVSDYLGVGRNMAKSIRHWMLATKLARPIQASDSKRSVLELTDFGKLVHEHDPYLVELGTWWMLHINLVNNPDVATTWAWFFNSFAHDRFDKAVCLETLRRFIEMKRKKAPSMATLERDLGCLLVSYARTIPIQAVDPEDGTDCPLRELGLLSHFKSSGYYQLNKSSKAISSSIFGYAVAKSFEDFTSAKKTVDLALGQVAKAPGGPGRVFCLNDETLFEVASDIESQAQDEISIAGLAGERLLRIACLSELDWAKQYYISVSEGSHVTS